MGGALDFILKVARVGAWTVSSDVQLVPGVHHSVAEQKIPSFGSGVLFLNLEGAWMCDLGLGAAFLVD